MRNRMVSSGIVMASLFLVSGAARASGISFTNYNVVTLGDLTTTQDIEGTVFVGGNLDGGPMQIPSNGNVQYPSSGYTASVAGNINATNVHIEQGSLLLGGSNNGSVTFNGGGSLVADTQHVLTGQLSTLTSQLNSAVTAYSALTANSSVTLPSGGQPGPITFNAVANANGVAVFNITTALFSTPNVQQVNLNLGAGVKDIVINVSGGGSITQNFNWIGWANNPGIQATTMWNFENATSLNIQTEFYGAVLAPDATLSGSSPYQGSLFIKSLNTNGEVHLPYFTGYDPLVGIVPEPSSLLLASLGGIGVACYAGMRRARARGIAS